jgi:hypothetical protein
LTIDNHAFPESALAHPFLRPGTQLAELKRSNVRRVTSWALVGALHVFLFTVLVISIRPFAERNRPVMETLMMFPALGNNPNAPPLRTINPEIQNAAPPTITTAPITVPKPDLSPDSRVREVTPGDILGAVGRELACSAGSWEHLSKAEREICGGLPWRGMRLPNGSLVMVPPSQLPRLREPDPNEGIRVTGAEQLQRDLQTGQNPTLNGCPILQHTPCLHPSMGQGGIKILGGN